LLLEPGEYFPFMARPSYGMPSETLGTNPDASDKVRYTRARSTGQLHALIGQLELICRVVHPDKENLKSFGHEIRNVLILACTEVEAHWKGVLAANGATGESTKDYVKLSKAMKLNEFLVDFNYYPWMESMNPFEKWGTSSSSTKDLEWYYAYNQVKHDREQHFAEAALIRAFQAIAACFVMLCAQYGWDFALKGNDASRAFLKLSKAPTWDPSDCYVPEFGHPPRKRNYNFE
jgi:hypothetical protein